VAATKLEIEEEKDREDDETETDRIGVRGYFFSSPMELGQQTGKRLDNDRNQAAAV
jgi:hypothetical protein